MKLQEKYYDFILNGTKKIELRLNDEKRQKIKLGDKIRFLKEPELKEFFEVKVIGLLRYNSFQDMIKDYDISLLADKSMTKDELLNVLEEFYTKEKQEKYGVLGIRIELDNKSFGGNLNETQNRRKAEGASPTGRKNSGGAGIGAWRQRAGCQPLGVRRRLS